MLNLKELLGYGFLVLLVPGLSASPSSECRSPQEVTESVERDLRNTLARTYAQVDELLAPVSTFLQAALMKQVLAEYGFNPSNSSCKCDPLLYKLLHRTAEIESHTAANPETILGMSKTLTELLKTVKNLYSISAGFTDRTYLVRKSI